jgi:NAD(P)H-nitrite reductase large subunit
MVVDRCVCHRQTFAMVASRCQDEGLATLADIARVTKAGTGCGSCRPYLQAMLDTGAVRFAVRLDPSQPIRPLTSGPA